MDGGVRVIDLGEVVHQWDAVFPFLVVHEEMGEAGGLAVAFLEFWGRAGLIGDHAEPGEDLQRDVILFLQNSMPGPVKADKTGVADRVFETVGRFGDGERFHITGNPLDNPKIRISADIPFLQMALVHQLMRHFMKDGGIVIGFGIEIEVRGAVFELIEAVRHRDLWNSADEPFDIFFLLTEVMHFIPLTAGFRAAVGGIK